MQEFVFYIVYGISSICKIRENSYHTTNPITIMQKKIVNNQPQWSDYCDIPF